MNDLKPAPRRHRMRRLVWILATLAVLLVGARVALPYFIERYVNRQLSGIHEYTGSIGTVRVHLWRGAYTIHDIRILKSEGKVPLPLFSAPVIDLSMQWKELFHGSIVGKVMLQNPEVNFVKGTTSQETQSGFNQPWATTLDSLFPFNINLFEIRNGQIRFQDLAKPQQINLYLSNVWATATNLSNSRNLAERLPAGLQATGRTMGNGEFRVNLHMDPQKTAPTFELNALITNLDLVQLNDFLRGYAKLDVARGSLSIFTSVASEQGKYDGYVKVLCNNLDLFAWNKERKKNVLEIVWQGIAGVLAAGFKNHPHDQLAARIPINGTFTQTHVDTWATVGSMLQNAFVAALKPRIEPIVHLEDVEKKP